MNKEEKEAIIIEYTNYWTLVNSVRDIVLDALDALPIGDAISVLDRVKTELTQQEMILSMDEEMQSGHDEETESEPINPETIKGKSDGKVEALLENIKNLGEVGNISKEVKERINS